jgi:hypothetical protein
MGQQRVCLPGSVYADHEPELAWASCFDSGQCILEHDRLTRLHPQCLSPGQEGVRRRLPGELPAAGGHTVDPLFEELLNARGNEHLSAVGAGGDHGPAQSGLLGGRT